MNPDSVPKFYYVYVLRSQRNSRWYVGFTMDLRKRFKEHNEGKYNSWTKGRGPSELIYYEAYRNKSPHLPSGVLDPAGRISTASIHPRSKLRGTLGRWGDKADAQSREKQLKSGQGRAYLKQRVKRFLTLSGWSTKLTQPIKYWDGSLLK